MQRAQQTRAFIPACGHAHLDGLRFWDFEWEICKTIVSQAEPPVKLPRGWRNRQQKRLDRITREIAELDVRIRAADIEKTARVRVEIQRDLVIEAEKDLRMQELNRRRADLQADAEITAKYVAQVIAAMGRAVNKEKKKLLKDIARDHATILAALKRRFRPETRVI